MAIIKLGMLVSGIRGTIGGVTYSAGKSGPWARMWSRGANPRSSKQTTQRSRMANLPALWRTLTDTQRDDWATWAALPAQELINPLGDPYFISGYAWFTKTGLWLLTCGRGPREDPPTDTRPGVAPIQGVLYAQDGPDPLIEVIYDPDDWEPNEDIVIECVVVPRGGRSVMYSGFLLVAAGALPLSGVYDITAEYLELFPAPQVGDRAFFRIYKQTDEGQRGAPWSAFYDYV